MTEAKNLNRLEEADDGQLRVVVKHPSALWDYRSANVLEREHPALFTDTPPKTGGPDRVRVCYAGQINTDGWHLHGTNGIYAEVPIVERELTDAEQAWCDEGFSNRNADTVTEFVIPTPEDLETAIVGQDLERFDCLDAVIENNETRHDVLTELQRNLEHEAFRSRKLNPRKGQPIDLDPEWDPENDHNDGKGRDHLYDMASMRKDAHLGDFRPIAGFEYHAFWFARARVLDWYEPNLEAWDIVGLDVVDADGWDYCQECAAVAPDEQFLHVDLERVDGTRRVCDRCADSRVEFGHDPCYTAENVSRARDERVQEHGGQRNLVGEYGGESDGH